MSVTLAEPYLKAWVGVIAGLLPPAGVGLVFLLAFLIESLHGGSVEVAPAVAIGYSIACIPLSIIALAKRQWFLRLSRPQQQQIASVVWVAFLAAFFYMLSQFR